MQSLMERIIPINWRRLLASVAVLSLFAMSAVNAENSQLGIDRVQELYRSTEISRNAHPDEAIKQGQTALAILDKLAKTSSNQEWRALILTNIAWSEGILSNHERALNIAKNALQIAEDSGSKKALARCKNTIAILNREIGNFEIALEQLQEVLNLEIGEGNVDRIITTQNNLGYLLHDMGRYNDSLGIYIDALAQVRADTDVLNVARIKINMASTLVRLGDYNQAIQNLDEVLKEGDKLPLNLKALSTQVLGDAYFGLGDVTKAETLLTDALVYWSSINDAGDIVGTRLLLAKVKQAKGDYEVAERLLIEAEQLARSSRRHAWLRNVLEDLSHYYEKHDLQKALNYSREQSKLNQKIFSDNLGKRLGQFQTRLEQSQRESELALLKRENELKEAQVKEQRFYLYTSVSAVMFVLLLLVFLVFRLRVRRQMHEATSAARERALAQISHEFRTPLTGIIGVSELLQNTALSPEQLELMRTVHYSSESLLGLVNDLLDISQLDAGKLVLQQKNFDLRHLIESVLELFSLIVEQKDISLCYRLPLSELTEVIGDPQRIRQILVNLISNAIKFTEKGSVIVSVHWQKPSANESELVIDVQDTGIGIRANQLKLLFEPFEQADDGVGKGTGLGLNISRQIARQMGGDIVVSSEPNIGSCFSVRLRLQQQTWRPIQLKHLPLPYVVGWQLPSALATVLNEYLLEVGVALEPVTHLEEAEKLLAPKVFVCSASTENQDSVRYVMDRWPEAHILLLASPRMRLYWEKLPLTHIAILNRPLRPGELVTYLSAIVHKEVLPKSAAVVATISSDITPDPTEVTPKGNIRALVVDDNEVNRVITKRMLERMLVQVDVCNDGRQAVNRVQTESYDVIFMDCQMPEMDGYQATTKIREQTIPSGNVAPLIIAMTANAMDGDKDHCLSVGMNDYLPKPIRMEDLARVLKKHQLLQDSID